MELRFSALICLLAAFVLGIEEKHTAVGSASTHHCRDVVNLTNVGKYHAPDAHNYLDPHLIDTAFLELLRPPRRNAQRNLIGLGVEARQSNPTWSAVPNGVHGNVEYLDGGDLDPHLAHGRAPPHDPDLHGPDTASLKPVLPAGALLDRNQPTGWSKPLPTGGSEASKSDATTANLLGTLEPISRQTNDAGHDAIVRRGLSVIGDVAEISALVMTAFLTPLFLMFGDLRSDRTVRRAGMVTILAAAICMMAGMIAILTIANVAIRHIDVQGNSEGQGWGVERRLPTKMQGQVSEQGHPWVVLQAGRAPV